MIKFMINYIQEEPKQFITDIATFGMIVATTCMFYFLGYVFFG